MRNIDIEKAARAIEKDAGAALPDLREALQQGQAIARLLDEGKPIPENLGRVSTAEQLLVRGTRAKLGMSQTEFAARIGMPVATLRDWEQGRFAPPGAALVLLRLLAARPKLAKELVA